MDPSLFARLKQDERVIRMVVDLVQVYQREQIQSVLASFRNLFPSLQYDDARLAEVSEKIAERGNLVVANHYNDTIGFAAFYVNDKVTHTAFLSLIAVSEEYQKSGVGKELLDEVISISTASGMKKLRLKVRRDNPSAVAFYKRNLFVVEDCLGQVFITMIKEL